MNILIKNINIKNEACYVEFISNYGFAKALWQGEVPQIEISYDVEIEIPTILRWGDEIRLGATNELKNMLTLKKDKIFICGVIESVDIIDDNKTCEIRVGDSLIIVDVEGIPDNMVGKTISITTENIVLYPVWY